jgi:hypothetical protein
MMLPERMEVRVVNKIIAFLESRSIDALIDQDPTTRG